MVVRPSKYGISVLKQMPLDPFVLVLSSKSVKCRDKCEISEIWTLDEWESEFQKSGIFALKPMLFDCSQLVLSQKNT